MAEDRARDISGPVISHAEFRSAMGWGPPPAVRTTFLDADRQARFERVGFCVIPFLDRSTIAAVRAVWDAVGPAPGDERDGFFPGNASSSMDWKREVIGAVTPLVADRIEATFDRHHPFHLTFMAKWPGPGGRLQAHQDSTMVGEEDRYHALNVWCPLDDPDEVDHGALGLLRIAPGSHHLPSAQWYRGRGGFIPSGFDDAEVEVYERIARPVPLRFGEAVAFDHRVMHCSSPNTTDRVRLVLAIGLRPAEAHNIHVECDPEGVVDFYDVDDDYFVRHPYVDMADYPRTARIQRHPIDDMSIEQIEQAEVLAETGTSRAE